MVLAGITGWAVAKICVRLKSDYLAMASIGIAEILRLVIVNEQWLTNGSLGIAGIPRPFGDWVKGREADIVYLVMVWLIVLAVYLLCQRLYHSPWGRILRAIRDNEHSARAAGKDVDSFRMQTFVIGAALMGLAGALSAHYFKFLSPSATEPLMVTFLVWVMLMAGGSGNNRGAILGAVVIWFIWSATEIVSNRLPPEWITRSSYIRMLLVGLLLQIVLQRFRQGLMPEKSPNARIQAPQGTQEHGPRPQIMIPYPLPKANPDGYFLYHSIGMYPGKEEDMTREMAEFARVYSAPNDKQWGYILRKRQDFIDYWRYIINAPKKTITACDSVTQGVHSVVTGLPEKYLKGRKVLVSADCFPSVHFLLAGLAPRLGFELETVPLRQGATWVESEDFASHWDKDVGLALITWVTSTASARCDLDALVEHGRKMDSVIGVDITQAAGLLPFDVQAPKIDFAVSTSLKWMCGTPGAGIIYMDTDLVRECRPELRGWFSQNNPFSWALDKFSYAPDIRRFDSGTPASMAAIASVPALKWHAEPGPRGDCPAQSRPRELDHRQGRRSGIAAAKPARR